MKTSLLTGEQIYKTLEEKMMEIDNLTDELGEVKVNLSEDSVTYNIVNEKLEEKKKELKQLEQQTYSVYHQPLEYQG